ncbi:MAG: hypothetical protein JWP75_2589 [Frondihabitans sp.]|jgi:hypothetical protein|nr:hypothetical protein [Frondihabitans sp.]
MELLFVTLGGVILGLAVRYTFPNRSTYGAALLPALGAVAASAVWAALTWAGWKFDGGWIWVASLLTSGVVAVLGAVVLSRTRMTSDAEMLQRLSRA